MARDEPCRRFMAIPGVGPVTALTFSTTIDPKRFRRSRDVAAYFGLTSRRWHSGASIDVQGRISKAGDPEVRRALYEAASAMLTRYKARRRSRAGGRRSPRVPQEGGCRDRAQAGRGDACDVARRRVLRGSAARRRRVQRRADGEGSQASRRLRMTLGDPFNHQIGAQLERLGDPLRRMRTGADHGRREARYLACGRSDPGPRSSACDAAPPIRCRHAPRRIDDRSDGPQPAVDERGRVHDAPEVAGWAWIDRVFNNKRAVSLSSASSDKMENRGRRWPSRGKRAPNYDGKIKAALPLVDLLWSVSGLRRAAGKGSGAAFPE